MRAATLSALAVVFCAPPATSVFAQALQYRIVERTGQTQASPTDRVLDLAVQARFTGLNLGGFNFDARIVGEAEGRGTLERGAISNVDGTYDPSFGVNPTAGRGGVARQYSYLANVTPSFNGLINTSGGTFTNGPDQEIGLIAGYAEGGQLLGTPGLDVDGDGNPDTWSGNGSGMTPAAGAIAALNPALAGPYFGGGQFIDVYRFRYTVTDLSARNLHFVIAVGVAEQFTQLVYGVGGLWAAQNTTVPPTNISASTLDISVIPAPGAAIGLAGLAAAHRRRRPR